MELILHFNRKSLSEIKHHLRKLTRDNLNFIELVDFCGAIMRKLMCDHAHHNEMLTTPAGREVVLRAICAVFFAVDVDYRCAISWTDFSAFCLRLIRNKFAMNVRQSPVQYVQSNTNGPIVPASRMYYCQATGRLYMFDNDVPTVRVIGKNLRYDGNKFNPCAGILRYLSMYCLENANKKVKGRGGGGVQISNVWKNKMPSLDKGMINAMQYINRTNQFALATSDNFVSYWDVELRRLVGFERLERPQVGLCYSMAAEMLVGWGCSGADTSFSVMNPVQRITKYKVRIHKEYPLHACEVKAHGCMVSCSIDRTVCIWPIKFIKTRANSFVDKYEMSTIAQYTDAEIQAETRYFRGNKFAIKTLVYATDNDLVIGMGFDFDMYAWDPASTLLMMNLTGHSSPLLAVHVVHTPIERVVSGDESGTIKMWNIDRSLGHTAEQLQHIQLVCANHSRMLAFAPAFQQGSTLVALADRVYYLHGVSTAADDIRPVPGGLGISHGNNQLWIICRGTFACSKLNNGMFTERLEFHSADRTDTTEVSKGSVNVLRAMVSKSHSSHGHSHGHGHGLPTSVTGSLISPTDEITAVTTDTMGKKIFVGTIEGHVYMFDGCTFGLLRRLTSAVHHQDEQQHHQTSQTAIRKRHPSGIEDDGPANRQPQHASVLSNAIPFVVQLNFITHDELLIVSFSNHAVKVFAGCYRVLAADQPRKYNLNDLPGAATNGIFNQSSIGGNAPHSPLLLRECRYRCHPFVPLHTSQGPGQAQGQSYSASNDCSGSGSVDDGGERHDVFAKDDGPGTVAVSNDSIVLCASVSEDYHMLAVSSDDGCIRLYNYLDLRLLAVLMAPKVRRPKPTSLAGTEHMEMEVEVAVCSVIMFIPHMPVLVGADNFGRLTLWATKPLACMWVLTWCASIVSKVDGAKSKIGATSSAVPLAPSYAAETTDRKSRDRENCPTSHPLTALSCMAWISEKAVEQKRKMSVLNANQVFRKMIHQRRESKSVASAAAEEQMKHTLSKLHRQESQANVDAANHAHAMSPKHAHSSAKLVYVGMDQTHMNEVRSIAPDKSRKGGSRRSGIGTLSGLSKTMQAAKNNFWVLVVGDSEGRVFVHDISKIIIRSGLYQEVENYNNRKISSAPIFPYGQGKKYHLYESLDVKSCEEISGMIHRPIGSMQATLKVGYQGVSANEVTVRNFYNFQGAGGVKNILPMQAPNKMEQRVKPLLKPESIFISTTTSTVKLFDWNGHCLGEVSDGVMATVDLEAELVNKRAREKQEYQDKVDALEQEKVNYQNYLKALDEYNQIQEEKKKAAELEETEDSGGGKRQGRKGVATAAATAAATAEHEPTAAEIIKNSKSTAPPVQKPPADSVPIPDPTCGIINGFGWDYPEITEVRELVISAMMHHIQPRIDDVMFDKEKHTGDDIGDIEDGEDRALGEGMDKLHESLSSILDGGGGSLLLFGEATLANKEGGKNMAKTTTGKGAGLTIDTGIELESGGGGVGSGCKTSGGKEKGKGVQNPPLAQAGIPGSPTAAAAAAAAVGGLASPLQEMSDYSWSKTLRAMNDADAAAEAAAAEMTTLTLGGHLQHVHSHGHNGHDHAQGLHGHGLLTTLHSAAAATGAAAVASDGSMEIESADADSRAAPRDPTERLWESLSAKAVLAKVESDKALASSPSATPFVITAAPPQSYCNGIVQLKNFQVEMDARDSLANVKQKKNRALDAMLLDVYERKERVEREEKEKRERLEAEAEKRRHQKRRLAATTETMNSEPEPEPEPVPVPVPDLEPEEDKVFSSDTERAEWVLKQAELAEADGDRGRNRNRDRDGDTGSDGAMLDMNLNSERDKTTEEAVIVTERGIESGTRTSVKHSKTSSFTTGVGDTGTGAGVGTAVGNKTLSKKRPSSAPSVQRLNRPPSRVSDNITSNNNNTIKSSASASSKPSHSIRANGGGTPGTTPSASVVKTRLRPVSATTAFATATTTTTANTATTATLPMSGISTPTKDHPHAGVISMKPPKPLSAQATPRSRPLSRTPSRKPGNFLSDDDEKPKVLSNAEKMDKILANFEHEAHNFVGTQPHHIAIHHLRDEEMNPDEYLSNRYVPIRPGLEDRVMNTMSKFEAKFLDPEKLKALAAMGLSHRSNSGLGGTPAGVRGGHAGSRSSSPAHDTLPGTALDTVPGTAAGTVPGTAVGSRLMSREGSFRGLGLLLSREPSQHSMMNPEAEDESHHDHTGGGHGRSHSPNHDHSSHSHSHSHSHGHGHGGEKEKNPEQEHAEEVSRHMALFAKQRITQAELNEALATATRKKGLDKMRAHGIHIRYGPYKTKDMFAFVRLLSSMEEARIAHMDRLEAEMEENEEAAVFGDGEGTFSTFTAGGSRPHSPTVHSMKGRQSPNHFNFNNTVTVTHNDSNSPNSILDDNVNHKPVRTKSMVTNHQLEEIMDQAKRSILPRHKRKKPKLGLLQLFAERPQQEIILEQLLAAPQVSCHYKLVRELEYLKSSDLPFTQTIITKGQLIPILFYHCSAAEMVRITALIDATYAIWTICKYYLIQPVKALVSQQKGHGHTVYSHGHGHGHGGVSVSVSVSGSRSGNITPLMQSQSMTAMSGLAPAGAGAGGSNKLHSQFKSAQQLLRQQPVDSPMKQHHEQASHHHQHLHVQAAEQQQQHQQHQSQAHSPTIHANKQGQLVPLPPPHPVKGYEGWQIEQYRLHDLRLLLDNMHRCEEGTILGQDLVEIMLGLYPENKNCQQLNRLHLSMPMNNIYLEKEVTGSVIVNFFKFCLKIKTISDLKL